jgi:hypothetical protein
MSTANPHAPLSMGHTCHSTLVRYVQIDRVLCLTGYLSPALWSLYRNAKADSDPRLTSSQYGPDGVILLLFDLY